MTEPGDASVQEKLERLTAIRKRLGWSEETCARELGVSYSTLGRWARGESLPNSRLVLEAIDRFISAHEAKENPDG